MKLITFFRKSDPFYLYPFLLAVVLLVLLGLALLIQYHNLPERLPLFYSNPWGQKQLAPKAQFLLLPVVAILVNLVNSLIAWHLHPSQTILKRTLLLSSIVVSLTVGITAFKILWIFW